MKNQMFDLDLKVSLETSKHREEMHVNGKSQQGQYQPQALPSTKQAGCSFIPPCPISI
ncbi:hypothetical protein [Viridibacillus arvi]|jgi:hypothetical protein|uniref:hypothetical protein n=1 Tax=Viridibacillus arvi TaxID=263475 RepID=UPI0012EDEB6B|nr:hypothetical protein [Viridibacillus arvi]